MVFNALLGQEVDVEEPVSLLIVSQALEHALLSDSLGDQILRFDMLLPVDVLSVDAIWQHWAICSIGDALLLRLLCAGFAFTSDESRLEDDLVLEDILHFSILLKIELAMIQFVHAGVPEVDVDGSASLLGEDDIGLQDDLVVLAILRLHSLGLMDSILQLLPALFRNDK